MVLPRQMLMSLVLAVLLLVSATAVGAAPAFQGKNKSQKPHTKARMRWSEARVVQVLNAGQSAAVTVRLTSNVDVSNVSLHIPGGLGRITQIDAAHAGTFNLQANTPTNITLTITMPTTAIESQGGVVKVLVNGRNTPASLKVLAQLPGDPEANEQDEPKEQKKEKGSAGDQGNGRGNGKSKRSS